VCEFINPAKRIYQDARFRLCDELKSARLSAGLRQRDVCRLMGKDLNFVSRREKGDRQIAFIDLLLFATIYQKNVSYFSAPLKPVLSNYLDKVSKQTKRRSAENG